MQQNAMQVDYIPVSHSHYFVMYHCIYIFIYVYSNGYIVGAYVYNHMAWAVVVNLFLLRQSYGLITGMGNKRKKLHAFFISSYLCYAEFGASGGTKTFGDYNNEQEKLHYARHAYLYA